MSDELKRLPFAHTHPYPVGRLVKKVRESLPHFRRLPGFSGERIQSNAFQRALLRSESYRIAWLISLLCLVMFGVIVRNIVAGEFRVLYFQLLVVVLALGWETFALAASRKALRSERDTPRAILLINVVIEAALPTFALVILIRFRLMPDYQALVAPAVFLYFLFIILSTLRLSPSLSLLTGILSALGYLGCAFYVRPADASQIAAFGIPFVYFMYAALIIAGGTVAAVVAGQLRSHVYAALREAALQHELDRVNHDLEIARSIQQGLLPTRQPRLTGFEVAGWNQPAEQTGGDYFDWQTLPDGRLAISLGDATGHGIGPALITASCRAYARASFLNGNPNGMLDHLNRLLCDDLANNRFITFAVVLLDPSSSEIEVFSAGHGPILWYRAATEIIDSLEAQGIPLGMIAGACYGRATNGRLEPGDMLAIVTDGFYEWENREGEQFGLNRLTSVIRESRSESADQVIARMRSAVMSFSGGTEQTDDLTAIVLRRTADAPVFDKSAALSGG